MMSFVVPDLNESKVMLGKHVCRVSQPRGCNLKGSNSEEAL